MKFTFVNVKQALFALVLMGGLFVSGNAVSAQVPVGLELNGYAWSSTAGWISLNCRTGGMSGEDICGQSNYAVRVTQTGAITGFAWSPHVGWIKFDNLSGWPTGASTFPGSASYTGTYPNLLFRGWARACAGTAGGNCTTMANNPESGAWDGWISLRGATFAPGTYGVNTFWFSSPYNFDSARHRMAWGSTVMGWIDMSTHVTFTTPINLSGTGCTITTAGGNTCNGSLSWSLLGSATNPVVRRTSPTPETTISTNPTGSGQSVSLRLGGNTFVARNGATGPNLTSVVLNATCGTGLQSVGGICAPSAASTTIMSFSASPSLVRQGATTELTWALSGTPAAGECLLSGPGISSPIDIASLTSYDTVPLQFASRFILRCGTNERSVSVQVVPTFREV